MIEGATTYYVFEPKGFTFLCECLHCATGYSSLLRELASIGREIAETQRLYKGENRRLQASLRSLRAPGLLPSMTPRSPPIALLAPLVAPATPLAEANESGSASAAAGEQLGGRQSRGDGDHLLWDHSFDVGAREGTAPEACEQQPVASAVASETASTIEKDSEADCELLAALSLSDALESAAAAAQPPSENLVEMLLEQVRKLQRENQRLADEKAHVERELYYYVRSISQLIRLKSKHTKCYTLEMN